MAQPHRFDIAAAPDYSFRFQSHEDAMAQPPYQLYAFWRSSATYRVRVALALKGLSANEHMIDLDAGDQRTEAFLKINPLGAPPAPAGRARVRSIAAGLAADTHPLIVPRVRRYLTTTGGFDAAAWRAWQIQWFTAGLKALEQRLATETATGTYCHGNSVTIADILLMSIVAVMRV